MKGVIKKAARRGGGKVVFSAILAIADGPFPFGDALAAMIMADEILTLKKNIKDIQGVIDDIKSEINEMVECENETKKKNGEKIKKEDKCKSLEGKNDCKSNPTGAYSGGKHETIQPGGDSCIPLRQSHHTPSKASYPKKLSSKEANDSPAIQMDKEDHRHTLSHYNSGKGAGKMAKAYTSVQKVLIDKDLTLVAMGMDILDIKRVASNTGNPAKYDDAITEMLLWSMCKDII